MKTFIIFGLLCFADIDTVTGINCINFWEKPGTKYNSNEECIEASKIVGDKIMKDMQLGRVNVTELTIWCIESNKDVDL